MQLFNNDILELKSIVKFASLKKQKKKNKAN